MEKEMNFFDLCVACWQAFVRGCKAFGRLLGRMVRLTYRYWWVVITVMVLAAAAALYYTRPDNRIYKVNAIALLNGPTVQQFEQSYALLRSSVMLPADAPVLPYIHSRHAVAFDTYRVIDCLDDGMPDFVDFKHKVPATDTINVQMQDRLCLQFRMKHCHLAELAKVEEALLATLNAEPAMQASYRTYIANLREEAAFNHAQAQKLDSLTSCYYFYPVSAAQPANYNGNGVNFYGDRHVRLFLKDIYEQHEHMQRVDYRLQLASAPVVLENHFAVDPNPVNGRMKILLLLLLFGWVTGCAFALLIDKRKAIAEWLKA